MEVHHQSLAPVFIIGHGSSGTSILSRLLREQLKISFGTESQFIVRYARRLAAYGDLRQRANLERLVSHIATERWFERCQSKFGFRTSPEAIVADILEPTYAGVLDAIFSQLARHMGTLRWGDKTPDYVHDLDVLGSLFPQGRYLHLVRDGRDVALSVMGRFWGAKNIFMAAWEWREALEQCEAFAASMPAAQVLTIRYEDLLAEPAATFDRLLPFLQIEADPALRAYLADELPRLLKRDNHDKWRKHWGEREQASFERVAGSALARHGYSVDTPAAAPRPTWLESCYWRMDNELRKLTFAGYWQDNLYKLSMRSRDAMRASS